MHEIIEKSMKMQLSNFAVMFLLLVHMQDSHSMRIERDLIIKNR